MRLVRCHRCTCAFRLTLILSTLLVGHCLVQPALALACSEALRALSANPYAGAERRWEIFRFEQARIAHASPEKPLENFQPQVGFTVIERDAKGNAIRAKIRVLVDNPNTELVLLSDLNRWGQELRASDYLRQTEGPYFEAIVDVRHGMEYRLALDGRQVLDPAAEAFTTAEYYARKRSGNDPPNLNSIFWDFDRPDAYRLRFQPVDLRAKPIIIAETEPWQLAKNWEYKGRRGPARKGETYRFIAESGLVEKIQSMGYTAVELMPLAAQLELSTIERPGDGWWIAYQAYGSYGPTTKYGTPDEFAMMADAFNRAGIAVILDIVPGHFPYAGNAGVRSLAEIGLHHFKKADGRHLFGGEVPTEYGTYRYDYSNPDVRRFLIEGSLTMMKRYGLSGLRLDNPDGIRSYPLGGGDIFIRELAAEVRRYRPEAILIAEQFNKERNTIMALDKDGLGFGFRTHYDWFQYAVRYNALRSDGKINIWPIRNNIRIWDNPGQVFFVTNHDLAGNEAPEGGASGAYFASLIGGGPADVEGRTKAWGALSMMSGGAYLDMPQFRLLQGGDLNRNPEVEWNLLSLDGPKGVSEFFSHLSRTIRDNPAFAFVNSHPDIENHSDANNKVISLARINFETGKRYYALINLTDRPIENYTFGIHRSSEFELLVDSDRAEFRGSGTLAIRVPSGRLQANAWGEHGKPCSVTVPYLAPYGVLLLGER